MKNQSQLEIKGEEKRTVVRNKETRKAAGETEMKKVEGVRKRERKLNFKPRPPRFS